MKKKFTTKATNHINPASPASIWGKGVPGKGGKTTNAFIIGNKNTNEKEND